MIRLPPISTRTYTRFPYKTLCRSVVDELRRFEGVGNVQVFASPYAMRVWLDPQKLANYRLSAAEALAAVQEQNSQSPGGQLGDLPIAGDRKSTRLNSSH